MKNEHKSRTYTGIGIVFGAALGPFIWEMLFDGGYAVGIGVGVGMGIVLGAIADSLGHVPWYTFIGIGLGTACGPILGALIGLVHGGILASRGQPPTGDFLGFPYVPEHLGLSIVFCAAVGMVLGTMAEVNHEKSKAAPQEG